LYTYCQILPERKCLESSYQKFTKDIAVIGVANLMGALGGVILLPLITKTMGAYDYGIWVQVNVTIGLAISFVGLGLPFAMTRFLAAEKNTKEIQEGFYSVLYFVFFAALVVSILLIILADFIGKAFFDGATQIVGITGLIILAWSLEGVCLCFFRSFRQMKKYALFSIADAYGQIGLIVLLVLNGYGLVSMVLAIMAIRLIILLASFLLIKAEIGVKKPHFSRMKEYLSFGLPTIPVNIAAWVVASSDRYVIGYFLGAESVGIYSAGYAIGSIPLMLLAVVGFVLPPALSKLYDEGRMSEVQTHLSYSLKYSLAVAIPFVFGSAILAEPVLRLFSNAKIAAQGYLVVSIVALSTLILVFGVISHILILVKKTKISGAAWIIAAVVNLGLTILLVPRMGILGAAVATLFAYSVGTAIELYYSFKEFKVNIDWRFIIKTLLSSAIMALVVWPMHLQNNINIIITVLVGIAVYGVSLFLLKGFKTEEISFFRALLQPGTYITGSAKDKTK
jgi:O-antigen/teichoic acid export membrane protein